MRPLAFTLFRMVAGSLFATLSAFTLWGDEAPRHVIFTWQGDTATTLTVNFQTFTPEPIPAMVYWDTEAHEGMVEDYAHEVTGTAFRIPGLDDRWVYRVELTGLEPGGTVHLVAGSKDGGISREYKVRTLPTDDRPLRFVTGGDMGASYLTRKLLREAAKCSPHLALVGGDIAYANGRLAEVDKWDAWLTYYTEEMITPEGFAIPVILAIGNHEVDGGYDGNKQTAPFYFGFFGQDPELTYFSRQLGGNLTCVVLDSGHVARHDGAQAAWLDQTLAQHAAVPFTAAIYHIPLYPSHRDFDGSRSKAGREHWAPLFDQHGLTVAFENHDHTYKRTALLKSNAKAADGTLYLGDGCWGRNPRTTDPKGRWFLEQSASVPHFWSVDVRKSGLVYRAVDMRGQVFDVYPTDEPDANEAVANFRALPRQFMLPKAWVQVAPWSTTDPRQGTSAVTFTNHSTETLEVRLKPGKNPKGSTLAATPKTRTVAAGAQATFALSFEAQVELGAKELAAFEIDVKATTADEQAQTRSIWEEDFDVPAPRNP